MQVSVETLSGLERKMTVTVPAGIFSNDVDSQLKQMAKKAEIKGFRPGKAKPDMIRKKYEQDILFQAAKKIINESLFDLIREQNLNPAQYPDIEIEVLEPKKDMVFSASFEVFPEVAIKEMNGVEVELVNAEVSKKDVDATIKKLQEQHKIFESVARKAKNGDKTIIDFEGFIDGEAFEGGKAERYELELGKNSFIEGFEDSIVGKKAGDSFDANLKFPESYHHDGLAGKDVVFKVHVHEVQEGKVPELDEEFIKKFNVKEGTVDAFIAEITRSMTTELKRRVSSMNKEAVFKKFVETNELDVPKALVEREKEEMAHQYYHMIYGNHHHNDEKIPDFLKEMVADKALFRVKLGLLFSKYAELHELKADDARVEAMLDDMASSYDEPEEFKKEVKADEKQLTDLQAAVLEEVAMEKMVEVAKVKKKKMSFDEVMNPKQPAAEEETNSEEQQGE